ncbi:hypothetical protein LSCM1_05201 [Leishmania martiniquensis]|uniref:Uncharacterized protein n=1 Tax=Leishmania martiniquensis TaxID=1580590 RepID=A0A836KI85_9TRYP|nr:hypothetical protein LSCM1_05201 [Leishmania martiniquensis]
MRRSAIRTLPYCRAGGAVRRCCSARNSLERRGEQQAAATKQVLELLPSPDTPPPVSRPDQLASFFQASFDPFVFSYCTFDFPAIVHCAAELNERELLDRPEAMLMPPRSLCLHHSARFRFGSARHQRLSCVLERLLHEHDTSERSPLARAQALGLECPLLVPFLRGVCLCVEVGHPFAPQAAYVFEELLVRGFVSSSLYLGGAYADRSSVLAQLLQLAAKEFGSESALFTGLLLLKEQTSPPDAIVLGRVVAQTFAAADRRRLDWELKARGALRHKLERKHGWTLGPHDRVAPRERRRSMGGA